MKIRIVNQKLLIKFEVCSDILLDFIRMDDLLKIKETGRQTDTYTQKDRQTLSTEREREGDRRERASCMTERNKCLLFLVQRKMFIGHL